jgi:polar amino acid transport system permease protein
MALSELAAVRLKQTSGVSFSALEQPLRMEPWGLAVRKGETALLSQINIALLNMEKTGEIQTTFDKWFGKGTGFDLKRDFTIAPISQTNSEANCSTTSTCVPPSTTNDTSLLEKPYPLWLWQGLLTTIELFSSAWIISMALGIILTAIRLSLGSLGRYLVTSYVELARNIPLLVQIMFWYFVVPLLLPRAVQVWLSQHDSEFATAALGLGFSLAAYNSEAIRSGIRAIPKTQIEAARALGFGYFGAVRRIILPQAFRMSIPPLLNNTVLLFKNTSIAMAIGVHELMYQTRAIDDQIYRTAALFGITTVIYLAGSSLLMLAGGRLERRLLLLQTS